MIKSYRLSFYINHFHDILNFEVPTCRDYREMFDLFNVKKFHKRTVLGNAVATFEIIGIFHVTTVVEMVTIDDPYFRAVHI